MDTVKYLKLVEKSLLWLSMWIVHNANHEREKRRGDVKVGGHQASSASMVSIMTALYFHILRPQDRVAVKPHASPVFHALQYCMGRQSLTKIQNFRGYGGAQSYPSRTKDVGDVDFSTGSVGLGVAQTAFASLVQDYVLEKHSTGGLPSGRMIALVGDAELDEGNIYECLQEGWKHNLRNTWWIVDYNRQSLDGIVHEGLWEKIDAIFKAFGWRTAVLRHGALQRAAFEEPGGLDLKRWIQNCPNDEYSALTFQGGAAWRSRLLDDLSSNDDVAALLEKRSDDELSELMSNLGGHCVETLIDAFGSIDDDQPTVFLAYTVKGWGTPLAGHKDNHAGLMNKAQMAEFRTQMSVTLGEEWRPWSPVERSSAFDTFLDQVPFFRVASRRQTAQMIDVPGPLFLDDRKSSTQAGFGKILDQLAKSNLPLAERILTTSPDVTSSTNLGAWVNRKGLFSRIAKTDKFQQAKIPSTQKWNFSKHGQHIELGIAEVNLFLLLGAAGLSHSLFGERIIPIGTVYDPFVARGLDALNYACYQDARFMIVGTPSGVTLAPEGGAHQSIGTPLIGMSQDGLASFEPAFLDELSIIMDWGFNFLQRTSDADPGPNSCLNDEKGGSVYLRLSTRPIEQIGLQARDGDEFARCVIDGAYWMRPPGPNCELIIAYQGCVAPEAIEAVGMIGSSRRDVGLLAITSSDRLHAGWSAAKRARASGRGNVECHIETLLKPISRNASVITVTDGHPASLSWIGAVKGNRTIPLGVDHFGQTGTISDLYRHYQIDAPAIIAAASNLTPGRLI